MKKEKCYFMVDRNLRMVVCKNCFQYRAEEMGEIIRNKYITNVNGSSIELITYLNRLQHMFKLGN